MGMSQASEHRYTLKDFTEELKECRTSRGYSVQAKAHKCSIGAQLYADIESGKTIPDTKLMGRLCAADGRLNKYVPLLTELRKKGANLLDTLKPTHIGEALKSSRREAKWSPADVCRYLPGVAAHVYMSWEEAERPSIPEQHRNKLAEVFPELATVLPHEAPPALKLVRSFTTFGEALKFEREQAGLELDELGKLTEVSARACKSWEDGDANPVRDNYVKLLDLFPGLHQAPKPDIRDIPQPVGRGGNAGALKPSAVFSPPAPTITNEPPKAQEEPDMPEPSTFEAPTATPPQTIRDWTRTVVKFKMDMPEKAQQSMVNLLENANALGLTFDDLLDILRD